MGRETRLAYSPQDGAPRAQFDSGPRRVAAREYKDFLDRTRTENLETLKELQKFQRVVVNDLIPLNLAGAMEQYVNASAVVPPERTRFVLEGNARGYVSGVVYAINRALSKRAKEFPDIEVVEAKVDTGSSNESAKRFEGH